MPTHRQPALLLHPHRNHFLFSDYYLEKRIHEHPDWGAADDEAGAALVALRVLWQQVRPDELALNESQTEHQWIQPVLERLGHHYNVQVSLQTPYGIKKPDYLFYPDVATLQAALHHRGPRTEQDIAPAIAIGDAKAWDLPLDRALSPTHNPAQASANPGVQIDFYIRHSGLAWGVLTNGRLWRLYHRESSRKLDVYYEVDLAALLEQDDPEPFKYFYLFFRRDAFITGWLEEVLASSRSYEKGVSEDLKEQVYEALRALAQGFLDFPGNRLTPTDDTLKLIYDNSLIVLYRLLFILYAESRGLLPLHENSAYTERYSLDALKKNIVAEMQFGRPAVRSIASLWAVLLPLWEALDRGSAELGVPAYNGGLFNPEKHSFLERYKVGDLHMRQAIDLLARAEEPLTGSRDFVDYRDLAIRHLGSIYEGLLEYHLQMADTGEVELRTDKGERKATGSYYTPDYIVQYIVEDTVGSLVDGLLQRHGDDKPALVQAILALNILDPAAGSGHFLVGATDYLARRLVDLTPPLLEWGEGAAESRGRGPSSESDLAYWRRRVVQSCIYGVDLNPLAVELAKLSLWLTTVAKDKLLNFLDHHLRPGNSLVGARVETLLHYRATVSKKRAVRHKEEARAQVEAGQLPLFEEDTFRRHMGMAVGSMWLIEGSAGRTLEEVKEQERVYEGLRRDLTARYRRLADLATAEAFGAIAVEPAEWNQLVALATGKSQDAPAALANLLHRADVMAFTQHFFHWELEFPEVFFDEQGEPKGEQGGFDAVIGNPPYKVVTDNLVKNFIGKLYETSEYQYDLFVAFMEQAVKLVRNEGVNSLIVPTTFMVEHYFSRLRAFMLTNSRIVELLHFKYPVFKDATVESAVYCLRRSSNALASHDRFIRVAFVDHQDEITGNNLKYYQVKQAFFAAQPGQDFNISIAGEKGDIFFKINTQKVLLLGTFADIVVGVKPYQVGKGTPKQTRAIVDSRMFDSNRPINATYKQYLMGRDMNRYAISPLEKRWISYGDWLAEPRLTAQFFEPKKILIRQTGDSIIAALDTSRFITLNNIHTLKLKDNVNVSYEYILALLNSHLITYYHQLLVPEAGRVFAEVKIVDLQVLPIRVIDFLTFQPDRANLLAEAQHLHERGPASALLSVVEAQLAQDPERADVIHDLLAWLAAQMIDLHQQKQSTVEDFWLDLEGVTDSATFATLRHKGKWETSLWKSDACRPFVDEHSRATRTLDESLGWNEDAFKAFLRALVGALPGLSQIVHLYRQHAPTYEISSRKIKESDLLIDQIVYRLYGLSDEEIALVEGP
ncbi:MAG: Eco57I restriction-modification methylase domain-containing protein [Ardenticatenales bacterium]|nr:Eco57I restriction-modification methylase domain-containing protein [Ardenticatenales bacterium]